MASGSAPPSMVTLARTVAGRQQGRVTLGIRLSSASSLSFLLFLPGHAALFLAVAIFMFFHHPPAPCSLSHREGELYGVNYNVEAGEQHRDACWAGLRGTSAGIPATHIEPIRLHRGRTVH